MFDSEKTESFETSPLNPITNKKYADEIQRSMDLLFGYDGDPLSIKSNNAG